MLAVMAKEKKDRIKFFFDTEERIRRAVKLRAVKSGLSTSEVINRAIEASIPAEVKEAETSLLSGEQPKKSTRGRKPKAD